MIVWPGSNVDAMEVAIQSKILLFIVSKRKQVHCISFFGNYIDITLKDFADRGIGIPEIVI